MSIYNCTVSELQHFVAITIADIDIRKLACASTQIEHYWIFADPVTFSVDSAGNLLYRVHLS